MTDGNKKTQAGYQSDDSATDLNDNFMLNEAGESDLNQTESGRGNQGFASMPKDRQRTIASKGGKAAHEQGTAHEWDSQEAAEAGRKGGQNKSS